MNGRLLIATGAVVAIASVVIALPVFGPGAYSLVPLIAGCLAVAAGAASQKGETSVSSFRRSLKWALPFVVTGAGWVVAHFAAVEIDVTSERVNSLADESVAVAAAIDVDVNVVSFIEAGDRADVELAALAERYQRVSRRIRFERRSMKTAEGAAVARQLGVAELLPLGGANVVVVAGATDGEVTPVRLRFDAGLPNQEEQLTNALRRASSKKARTTVWIVDGHGEGDVNDAGAFGLSQWKATLLARGIELVPFPFGADDAEKLLPQGRAMIVPLAKTPRSDREHALILRFVDDGGAVLVLSEPDDAQKEGQKEGQNDAQKDSLQSDVAGRFMLQPLPGVIVDDSAFAAAAGGADTIVGSGTQQNVITRPLNGALTHFPHATAVASLPGSDDVEVVPLVSTSAEAKLVAAGGVISTGPLSIVMTARGPGAGKGVGRAVVAGDGTFVSNAGIGLGANRDLALNIVQWLVDDDSAIAVRPRQKTGALLFLTPTSRERLAFVLVFLIPTLLAALGAALSAKRSS